MPEPALIQHSPGHYAVSGELGFATVTELLHHSQPMFTEANVEVDLSGVTHADSAGLSLLVEWLRLAKQQGRQLQYRALPTQLQALAAISEVDGLFAG